MRHPDARTKRRIFAAGQNARAEEHARRVRERDEARRRYQARPWSVDAAEELLRTDEALRAFRGRS